MKRIINLKEIMIVLMSVVIIALIANTVLAVDPGATLGGDDYNNAQQPQVSNSNSNNSNNNSNNNNSNNNANNNSNSNNSSNNTARRYNTNNNTNLPQTGIEDYNVGILLVICVASAIYAYKKVKYYKNI